MQYWNHNNFGFPVIVNRIEWATKFATNWGRFLVVGAFLFHSIIRIIQSWYWWNVQGLASEPIGTNWQEMSFPNILAVCLTGLFLSFYIVCKLHLNPACLLAPVSLHLNYHHTELQVSIVYFFMQEEVITYLYEFCHLLTYYLLIKK